jgi:hypothetical protein
MVERRYRIHPAIGVARLGDAERIGNDFYFPGPEIPDVPANFDASRQQYNGFKKAGKVRPQAARFRIFEYESDADGKFHPKGEVKLGDGRTSNISWTVHLANRKANFCNFLGQIGAKDLYASYSPGDVRNSAVRGLDQRKQKLDLDPGPRTIQGGASTIQDFTINRPPLKIATLGQLRSDPDGRLLVIGGMGVSDHDPDLGGDISEYANNDGWFDDVCDGPVEATLVIDGVAQDVDGAWVLGAPPDFAPAVRSYRTMYDTLIDLIVREFLPGQDGVFVDLPPDVIAMRSEWRANHGLANFKPSFTNHVYPILRSMCRIMRIHSRIEGQVTEYHLSLSNYELLGARRSDRNARQDIFKRIRDPKTVVNHEAVDPTKMPFTLGDFYTLTNGQSGLNEAGFFHSVSPLQYELLRKWSDGDFDEDWTGPPKIPDDPPVTAVGLDRAALENAVGGAFYPGIEASWLFANRVAFRAPFRVARGTTVAQIPVPVPNGAPQKRPLVIEAGAFSQQMALPWQADFWLCRAESHTIDGIQRRIAWWPAQRPDNVFPVTGPTHRENWERFADGDQFARYEDMVEHWSSLGFIVDAEVDVGGKTVRDLFEVEAKPVPRPPVAPGPAAVA